MVWAGGGIKSLPRALPAPQARAALKTGTPIEALFEPGLDEYFPGKLVSGGDAPYDKPTTLPSSSASSDGYGRPQLPPP